MRLFLLLSFYLCTCIVKGQDYKYLGEFNSEGVPLYLDENDQVSQETLDIIADALPEGFPVPDYNPHYITSGYDTDIILDDFADVWVTFVGEGAGYRNVLGFYTYDSTLSMPSSIEVQDITIIFPNVSAKYSGGGLEIGNKVNIGRFPPNTGIGWVLLANAWSNGTVGNGLWKLYSNPDYNPENNPLLRNHNVLLADPENERIILGFEDIRRDYGSCDQDFNDALFYITANPYSAIQTENFVDVASATDVSSANDGGLESNGDLASLIAKRNFDRSKNNTALNTKQLQKTFSSATKSSLPRGQRLLSKYFPETGAFGTESIYMSSPEDLLNITNATEVFSADYYQNEHRVGAALATKTSGAVYNHTKTICDRLNGSEIDDVRTVTIRNKTLINTTIKRANGEVENTLHFSIKLNATHNELYSMWNIDQYPAGDYINFQIWGSSIPQVAAIANHIIDTFSEEKSLYTTQITDVLPEIIVKSGSYKKGRLTLDIINKTGTTQLIFKGNKRSTELSEEERINENISLTGAYEETVLINTGYIFDIGFSVQGNNTETLDALYLADGPWGIDYLERGVTIESFEITENKIDNDTNSYAVERNISVAGEVKETVNVFRNILAGNLLFDASDYKTVSFQMFSYNDVEVILVTEDLQDWNDRLRFPIPASKETKNYTIQLNDFNNLQKSNNNRSPIRSIVFSIQGDYQNFESFEIIVNDLSFDKENNADIINESVNDGITEKAEETAELDELAFADNLISPEQLKIRNYPNPAIDHTTIHMPKKHHKIEIRVVDMLGRLVYKEQFNNAVAKEKINLNTRNLGTGIYQYIINSNQKILYKDTFMIAK